MLSGLRLDWCGWQFPPRSNAEFYGYYKGLDDGTFLPRNIADRYCFVDGFSGIVALKNNSLSGYPTVRKKPGGEYEAVCGADMSIPKLMGMRTHEAAVGVYTTALSALGKGAEKHVGFMSAIFAELEPRDAIEAMLVAQMTATHVAMTTLIERMAVVLHRMWLDGTTFRMEAVPTT